MSQIPPQLFQEFSDCLDGLPTRPMITILKDIAPPTAEPREMRFIMSPQMVGKFDEAFKSILNNPT